MKQIAASFFCMVIALSAMSQRNYFLFVQSDNQQPFYIRLADKPISSSGSGHLTISGLKDSLYVLSVGFPQNKWPEQHFQLSVNGKDQGFLLKQFAQEEWGLFDLQTMSVQMASANNKRQFIPSDQKQDVSAFTNILSKAVNDSTLLLKAPIPQTKVSAKEEKEVLVKQPATPILTVVDTNKEIDKGKAVMIETTTQKEIAIATPKIDTANNQSVVAELKEKSVSKKEEILTATVYSPSRVLKKSEASTVTGTELIFLDSTASGIDTIKVLVEAAVSNIKKDTNAVKSEVKFLNFTNDDKMGKDSLATVTISKIDEKQSNALLKCQTIATESDFLKLRKQMAARETETDMIVEAEKYFKQMCFSSQHIRHLSALFLEDAGKSKFFIAAHPFVVDAENFSQLQSELKQPGYIEQFKNMFK